MARKAITRVNFERNGVKYQSVLDGHLTIDQVRQQMLMKKHVCKHEIREFKHAEIVSAY